MKNNTTSNDTCYTIQPLTTCIDIKTERKLIASWHTSGLSDVQIRKMLMLYFGEPAWMNLQKLYDCNSFSQIATGLKFRSRQEFVELLAQMCRIRIHLEEQRGASHWQKSSCLLHSHLACLR